MEKLKLLLTGGTGFIGRTFINQFSDTYEIIPLNLRKPFHETDFSGAKTILHLAALAHQMNGAPEENYFQTNFDLTKNLALYCKSKGVQHFIFMSTSHVYGVFGDLQNHTRRLNEKSECNPYDPYGRSKLQAEEFLETLQDDNFKVSIVRSPLVYGPGGKGNLLALEKLIRRVRILPFNYEQNARSLIFVENLNHFFHLIIQKKVAGILLPQDSGPVSIKEIVLFLAEARHMGVYLIRLPRLLFLLLCRIRPGIMQRLYGTLALDSSITNERLGYQALYQTKEAFKKTFST